MQTQKNRHTTRPRLQNINFQAETPRPQSPPPVNHPDSESDDEVGPSVAVMMTPAESAEYTRKQAIERLSRTSPDPNTKSTSEPKLQRDSWMLAPPTRADWLGTLDASKLKSRTFNQSKSGTNLQSKPVDHSIWTESPLERAQRLEDEALGKRPAKTASVEEVTRTAKRMTKRDRRIKEFNKQTRGPSLMEKYSGMKKIEDDDPSKRPFDYQKDIAGGRTLGLKERNTMINKAKDFWMSKYSGGSYLYRNRVREYHDRPRSVNWIRMWRSGPVLYYIITCRVFEKSAPPLFSEVLFISEATTAYPQHRM